MMLAVRAPQSQPALVVLYCGLGVGRCVHRRSGRQFFANTGVSPTWATDTINVKTPAD
jgi:hypothetical protein